MPRARESGEGKPFQTQTTNWLDSLMDEPHSRMAKGEHPGLSFLNKRELARIW